MSFMDQLRAKRQKFLEGLHANQGDINLDIFEDFYPDKAHFVFELLQNAEDTGATKCAFTLADDHLQFRHNGKRKFDEKDISSITGIHNSTKTKSNESIGKFGVGFKSVFIYTLTPQIHSGEYSFSITNLVMPEVIKKHPDLGDDTVFCFPFNNPAKKTATEAYEEIREGLEKLSELTLLFLKNIESVTWVIKGNCESRLYRVPHSEYHIEVIKELQGIPQSKSNFLRFSQPAKGYETQHVCLAFPLVQIDSSKPLEQGKSVHEQFKISQARPGRVSVFFPAENEASGLRFHIHAPFIPTLDRSSVKDTPVNDPLFSQIASFASETLHVIHRLNLLTPGFLGVLPNTQDTLSTRYEPIRVAIVDEMNHSELTPTHCRGFAPAKRLIQAKPGSGALKDLLDDGDLEILIGPGNQKPQWAIAATQRNNDVDRFLSSLAMPSWGVKDFLAWLKNNFTNHPYYIRRCGKLEDWLKGKDDAWLQKLYAILYREYRERLSKGYISEFNGLRLIKLTNGSLSEAKDCLFVDDQYPQDNLAKWVSKGLFNSGESLNEQKDSHSFLEAIGVRKVGERERVELLLKSRYQTIDFKPEISDIKIFIHHLEIMPKDLDLLKEAPIFKRQDGKWARGCQIFLDDPYLETGLIEVYAASGDDSRRPLSPEYLAEDLDLDKKTIRKFAEQLGAISNLEISEVTCANNPEWSYLSSVPGQNITTPINKDFEIKGFREIFDRCSELLSMIVWDTLCNAEEDKSISGYLTATFQKNQRGGRHQAPSQLVYQLRDTAWVPQKDSASVAPPYADPALLPPDFPFESDWKWVEAVKFGSHLTSRNEAQVQEEEILRKSLGIGDKQSLEEFLELAKVFSKLPPQSRRKHLNDAQQELNFDLPENSPKNPELRGNRVTEAAKNAKEKITEIRTRSVSVGRDEVVASARAYLEQLYSNDDKIMICQVCRHKLPFKLPHGGYYFEAIQFMPGLKLMHEQNYLSLCPNHAAMFTHANNSKHEIVELFRKMQSDLTIQIDLAGTVHSMLFTETHRLDLAAVLEAESTMQNPPIS